MTNVSEPAQPALSEQHVHGGEASASEDPFVWYFVAPLHVEAAAEAVSAPALHMLSMPHCRTVEC